MCIKHHPKATVKGCFFCCLRPFRPFRQTAARAPALQAPPVAFLSRFGVAWPDIGPCHTLTPIPAASKASTCAAVWRKSVAPLCPNLVCTPEATQLHVSCTYRASPLYASAAYRHGLFKSSIYSAKKQETPCSQDTRHCARQRLSRKKWQRGWLRA